MDWHVVLAMWVVCQGLRGRAATLASRCRRYEGLVEAHCVAGLGRFTLPSFHLPRQVQVQLHDNAGSVRVESSGGDIQLFLSPGATGRLQLRNAGRVAARPGTVRMASPQDDGSLLLSLPLGLGPAAGSQPVTGLGLRPPTSSAAAGGAAGAPQQPLSRLQRAAGAQQQQKQHQQQQQWEQPPPGNAVTSASRDGTGTDIVLDAGGQGSGLRLQCMSPSCVGLVFGVLSWAPASLHLRQGYPRPPQRVLCACQRPHVHAHLTLHAGGTGTISITERSWMDALRQKHGVR